MSDNATSITFDSEHDLMLLEDSDKFRLYIKPDIWTSILGQNVHTDIENLAKILWLFSYLGSGVTLTGLGYILDHELTSNTLDDLVPFVSHISRTSETNEILFNIKNELHLELDNQRYRQIEHEFDSSMAVR